MVSFYEREGDSWVEQQSMEGGLYSRLGDSIGISGDTLMITSPWFDGGIGDYVGELVGSAGVVSSFERTAAGWAFQTSFQHSNAPHEVDGWEPGWDEGDQFGTALAMDGDRMVVTAPLENSAAIGVGGDLENNDAKDSGAAYVFELQGGEWVETAYLKATNTAAQRQFGWGVAVSGDRIAVSDITNTHTYVYNGVEWEPRGILPDTRPVMDGDTMLIGAKLYEFDPQAKSGSHTRRSQLTQQGTRSLRGQNFTRMANFHDGSARETVRRCRSGTWWRWFLLGECYPSPARRNRGRRSERDADR